MVNYIRYRRVAKEDVKTKKLYVPELLLKMTRKRSYLYGVESKNDKHVFYKNGFRQNKKTE